MNIKFCSLFGIVFVSILGCSKSEDVGSVVPQSSVAIVNSGGAGINQDQANFNSDVYELEKIIRNADSSTREGESKSEDATLRLKNLRERILNSHIYDWYCVAFRPFSSVDLSDALPYGEQNGKVIVSFICSADQTKKFTKDINQIYGEEITLLINRDDARSMGKIFNNDRIKFSGLIQEFSSRGPGKYFMRVYADKVQLIPAAN